jgi:hypothetical protein
MNSVHSKYAHAYIASMERRKGARQWSALDIAEAYDAALAHAVGLDHRARYYLIRYMRALRVVNAARKEVQ